MNALLGVVSTLMPNNVISGFTFTDTINSTLSSYDVATEATAAGWNGTAIITATITQAASGEITGSFTTGILPAGTTVDLTIENTAFTRGSGGSGGRGGFLTGDGQVGTAGSTAISFLSDGSITVDAGGEISGGGGGGGGGGGFLDPVTEKEGNGGGGGGGFPNGIGGIGPLGATDGAAGTSGGGGAAGTGDNGGGNGGNGGGAATAGVSGAAGSGSGGSGGAAGSAIEKNGFTVVITNNGSINGSINS